MVRPTTGKYVAVAVTGAFALAFGLAGMSFVSYRAPWRQSEAAVLLAAGLLAVSYLALRFSHRRPLLIALWLLMAVSTVGVLRIHAGSRIPTIWSAFDLSSSGLQPVRDALAAGDRAAALGALSDYYRRSPARSAVTFPDDSPETIAAVSEQWLAGNVALGRSPVFELPRDLRWSENPFGNVDFQYRLHAMAYVSVLTQQYSITGDERYLERAEGLVLDWIDDNLRSLWSVGDPNPKYSWHDHTTAIRLRHWLVFWEAWRRSPRMTPERMEVFLQAVIAHLRLLVSDDFYTAAHNHGLDQDLAVIAAVGVLPELRDAGSWLDLATRRLGEQIETTIWPSGVHMEHSPAYHRYTMEILSSAQRFGEIHEMGFVRELELSELLSRMGDFLAQTMLPDRRLPQIGDTRPQDPLDSTHPAFRTIADREPLLAYVLSEGAQGSPPPQLSRAYAEAGYAILRDSWTVDPANRIHLVLTAASNPGRGHKHYDDLSFTLYGLGRRLLVDSGSYQYLYGTPERNFVVSPAAHNTVVVDRGAFVGGDPGSENWRDESSLGHATELETWRDDGVVAAVTASHENWPDLKHRRSLVFVRPRQILVVDHLASPLGAEAEHLFEQLWHFESDAAVRVNGDTTSVRDTRSGESLLRIVQRGSGRDSGQVVIGQREPMQGWVTTYEAELTPAPVAVFSERAEEALFVTSIEIGEAAAEASVQWSQRRQPGVLWLESGEGANALSIRIPIGSRESVSWRRGERSAGRSSARAQFAASP